jgi:hypothetical protein
LQDPGSLSLITEVGGVMDDCITPMQIDHSPFTVATNCLSGPVMSVASSNLSKACFLFDAVAKISESSARDNC